MGFILCVSCFALRRQFALSYAGEIGHIAAAATPESKFEFVVVAAAVIADMNDRVSPPPPPPRPKSSPP